MMRVCFFFAIFLFSSCHSIIAQPFDNPTAKLSTTWINNQSDPHSVNFYDGSKIRPILVRATSTGPNFACGFFCNGTCNSYLFAIFIIQTNSMSDIVEPASGFPQVVWSANRNFPVRLRAVLNLTTAGELVLADVDGRIVWSTNTRGKSVAGMKLSSDGNLVLFDGRNSVVWQSFDHPTDSLVPGQKLFQGQKLVASVSSKNWTQGLYSLQVTNEGLFAYVESNPPQVYYSYKVNGIKNSKERSYARFLNGSLSLFILFVKPNDPDDRIQVPEASSAQYMKLMPDGHLRMFEWQEKWIMVADLRMVSLGECFYPLACGRNSLCSGNQQCSCPTSKYFKAINDRQPTFGCSEITPLTCNATQDQEFFVLDDVSYFLYIPDMTTVDMDTCKQACQNNCSCKAAIFTYHGSNSSAGNCYLPSELFTMGSIDPNVMHYNASAFIKVQNIKTIPSSTSQIPSPPLPKRKSRLGVLLGSTFGSLTLLLLVVLSLIMFVVSKRKHDVEIEEEYLDQVPGMPIRFSYEELKTATKNFSEKLGEGGFGSVFKGNLEDGSQIAIKCLQGLAQVKQSFLAEVESIGSIHHVNLVRLRGFCAWNSQRLLVYEFMSNGSLDHWIYHKDQKQVLEWKVRKRIILDIAKGLTYLHEDCWQKIIHLDIKPQNILLDNKFNAKVSDFGLSKLIDRNQTQVMTTMKGTPGYLAPEWLSSVITEKVDVYSFGIVLLEILSGRKIFDESLPEESWHLLGVFQRCWEQGTLFDIIDKHSEDMQAHGTEVVEMMKVASWCLQTDFTRRPSMASVMKVMEGVLNVESNLDYNFTYPRPRKMMNEHEKNWSTVLPSLLSGPR